MMGMLEPGSSTPTDPYFSSVSLLLHMDGVNNSTSFPDNSPLALTVTANGNAKVSTTSPKFGTGALNIRVSGDNLSTSSTTGFAFGTADFTAEGWVYYDGTNTPSPFGGIFATAGDDFFFGYGTSTNNLIFYGQAAVGDAIGWAHGMSTNTWHHVAAVRNGANRTIYVDGNSIGTAADVSGLSYGVGAHIGYVANNPLTPATPNGGIDDIRVTKGVARYTSNFTPPTAAFPNS